jgi:UDP-N-acetylglucosamine/UDP-N-acetylgalactosamine diphosphorylase
MTHDFQDKIRPLSAYSLPDEANFAAGEAVLKQGKVGAIILAGGHGSRLGFDAPKGCYPILDGKSLYQLFAEKTLAASKRYQKDLPLAFMTSDATHKATVEHFEKANYFGLKKEQVHFFMQHNLPLQDAEGNNQTITAPDGNGALFWRFAESGLLDSWQVDQITVCTVDNALADPFEPNLIGLTALHNNEVVVVGIKRDNPSEHVGVLVEKNNTLAVIEYSEISPEEAHAKTPSGKLLHPLANISYFSFSTPFIKKVLTHTPADLPLHKAQKKIRQNGQDHSLYKCEYFIFDLLAFSTRSEVLLLPRRNFFAPLKNKSGPHSPETVRQALKQ